MYRSLCIALLVSSICAFGQLSAQEFVTDGLVSFWSFDRGTINGATVRDLWGSGNGTMTDTNVVAGKINEGLEFNGSSSMVTIDNYAALELTTAISVEAWIKLSVWQEDPNRNIIMARYDSGAGKRYIQFSINPTNGLATYIGHTNGTAYAQTQKGGRNDEWVGQWVHVAFTWDMSDGGLSRIYVDGRELESYANQEAVEEPLIPFDIPWIIGAMPATRFFAGVIDEVRVYDRRLSDSEILTNYNAQTNVITAVEPGNKLAAKWAEIKKMD